MASEKSPDTAKEQSKVTKEEWREYTKTVWKIANVTDAEHPAVFPVEIPYRLMKLFTFVGETILDPFAGVGTTAAAALNSNRKAICLEQNPHYVAIMKERLPNADDNSLVVRECDSRNMGFLDDDSVALVVTSPPYWNKADYGDGSSNLGNTEGYYQFFSEIRPTLEECYRVLMPGRKFCLVTANVNQHTNYGLLTFPLASDFVVQLRDIGFLMVSEIIWTKDGTGGKWGSWGIQRPIFGSYPYPPNFYFKNVHEYILIFAKPPLRITRGPKALCENRKGDKKCLQQ